MATNSVPIPYRLGHARPHHSPALSRLFSTALQQDFDYYSAAYRRATERANRPLRMAVSTLRSDRLVLGLWHGRQLIGYLIGAVRPATRYGDIFWLYVEPSHRHRGLGQSLVHESVRWLRAHQLEAVELVTYDNAVFYERIGFTNQRMAQNFVGGRDVYIMSMSLL